MTSSPPPPPPPTTELEEEQSVRARLDQNDQELADIWRILKRLESDMESKSPTPTSIVAVDDAPTDGDNGEKNEDIMDIPENEKPYRSAGSSAAVLATNDAPALEMTTTLLNNLSLTK